MSGGVDSSVAVAMLVEQGYAVFGIMLNLWSEPDSNRANRCCAPDSVAMARQVASKLSIPFYVLDARQLFFDVVIRPFIDDYTHNRTPNPCLACNRLVRWTFLFNHALAAGADYLATGHYTRLSRDADDIHQLSRAVDHGKDQSYVLHVLTQEKLAHALFPLGEYTKEHVRQLAQKYDLPVAERPDSQDLCFVGAGGNYREFISRYSPQAQRPGSIVDLQGKVLGHHPGLAYFTLGQRKGLGISSTTPLYVLEKDFDHDELVVGPKDQLGSSQLVADNVNWIAGHPPSLSFPALVKVRYTAREVPGVVHVLDGDRFEVKFENVVPDITPGQAAVLYDGDICLGGGIISN